jgi:hypothetical protein
LGCSASTVSSQASRALARLRELCPELAEYSGKRLATEEARHHDRG